METINIIMPSNTQTQTQRHICHEPAYEPAYDLAYDINDDDDALSINSYDSEIMQSKLDDSRYHFDDRHFDDDLSEDEEYEEDETPADQARKEEDEKLKTMLQGLSALDGKLNWTADWLEKINPVDDPEFPPLNADNTRKSRERKRPGSKDLTFKPAPHIKVVVGNKTSIGFKQPDQPEKRQQLCKSVVFGIPCSYGERCIFSHKQKPACRFGDDCKNRKCTFTHHVKKNSEEMVKDEEKCEKKEFKKMWLCRNMFKIAGNKIEKMNRCRFGENCIYAHSKEDVARSISECKFGEKCRSVDMTYIVTPDNSKVRRYANRKDAKQCLRLHTKERIIDFIKRTHHHQR